MHLRCLSAFVLVASSINASSAATLSPSHPPNVVRIFCDDLGYGDIGPFGAKGIKTPNLDRLARKGMKFTHFYVPQAVCSASRAALLTGCYPNRVGILGALGPRSKIGIHSNETTVAEMLKSLGYATALFGKWHLGDAPEFLPTRHGFDEYFGLPYSNDMWPHHPTGGANYPPLPLLDGEKVVEIMPDQTQLTTRYTRRAVDFIKRHREQPFFLYLAHNMPHVPSFVSDQFRGRSKRGLYGDVIEEIDWSLGEVLKCLDRHRLAENTLVIFTSDNGPWLLYGDHAGTAGKLREGKATSFDGGVRVPCLMRWPGKIPAGRVCRELASTLDVFPTLERVANPDRSKAGFQPVVKGISPAFETWAGSPGDRLEARLTSERTALDGRDLWPLMSGQHGEKSPHEAFFFYWGSHLQAVRSGPWKLHLNHDYLKPAPPGGGGQPGRYTTNQIGVALFHLDRDPSERRDLAARRPDIVARLQQLAGACRDDLGDSATGQHGRHLRPAGRFP